MSVIIEDVECVAETEKAICISSPLFDEDEWVPKSQVHEDSEVWKEGQKGNLIVKDWIAEQKGWE